MVWVVLATLRVQSLPATRAGTNISRIAPAPTAVPGRMVDKLNQPLSHDHNQELCCKELSKASFWSDSVSLRVDCDIVA